ncbi:hypothetical protein Q3G72_011984 [Acer saccharum]|nr:hypothetical protein Q3G72_011984 [Acer saccharum]
MEWSSVSWHSHVAQRIVRKKTKNRGLESREEEEEVPLIDMSTIAAATNNFSQANMIGKGGFGPVYKGNLSTGQEIAVKRLSNNSGQGVEEFKSECVLRLFVGQYNRSTSTEKINRKRTLVQ